MKVLQWLVRVAAWLPIVAAGLYASFAARFAEPIADRTALGEMAARWDFDGLFVGLGDVHGEPLHVVAQAWNLGLLRIPEMTLQWAAFGNVLLALLLVTATTACVRRAFSLDAVNTAWARLVIGLLVCSPAFGVDWLYMQRANLFLPPLLFVLAAGLMQGERHLGLRIVLAMLLSLVAPFCHTHGVVVFAALLPSLFDARRRCTNPHTGAWTIAWLIVGTAAAIASMLPAGGVALTTNGLFARLLVAPLDSACLLLQRIGSAWLDGLPMTSFDEHVLGACTLLLPLLAFRLGDRSDAARRSAAVGWSCLWFGLLLTLWQLERHGAAPAVGTVRELQVGAMLLPTGAIVLLAARFGHRLLPVGAGVFLVLGLQDWYDGIDALRHARMRVESREAVNMLPESIVSQLGAAPEPAAEQSQLQLLRQRGWSPARRSDDAALLTDVTSLYDTTTKPSGSFAGGDAQDLHGTIRSSLLMDTVQVVVLTVANGSEPARVVGVVAPEFARHVRTVEWSVHLSEALPEGARVSAIGLFARRLRGEQLGPPVYVVREGKLVAEEKG